MSERCKHIEKSGFNCGSYAFNLYKDGIDQGNLCDVHYWQAKALAQPEQEPVAWLSTDSIGERHLCFDKPLDNDPVQPLYTTPPQQGKEPVKYSDYEPDGVHHNKPEQEPVGIGKNTHKGFNVTMTRCLLIFKHSAHG
jgi:hypothetical protein